MLRWLRDRWARSASRPPPDSAGPGSGEEPAPLRLVVGLGNPGARYAATRHNVGVRVLERLAERAGARFTEAPELEARVCAVEIAGAATWLLVPLTFMNHSGESVVRALARWPGLDPTRDLLVVHDDLDLPVGRLRLRPAGGAGGHRGLGSILDRLDERSVPRLRFGIGHPGSAEAVHDWVLGPFSAEEEEGILAEALDRAADAVEAALAEGVSRAMGRYNAVPKNDRQGD